jgi:hypothetical protein
MPKTSPYPCPERSWLRFLFPRPFKKPKGRPMHEQANPRQAANAPPNPRSTRRPFIGISREDAESLSLGDVGKSMVELMVPGESMSTPDLPYAHSETLANIPKVLVYVRLSLICKNLQHQRVHRHRDRQRTPG